MFLLLILSISVTDINQKIENSILQKYSRSVRVTFKQGHRTMEVTKYNKNIIIKGRIPVVKEPSVKEPGEKLPEKSSENREDEKMPVQRETDTYREFKIASYDGEKFTGCAKEYFVSYIMFGCHCGFLYVIDSIIDNGYDLTGVSDYGHKIIYDGGTYLPKNIEWGNKRFVIPEWKEVPGFGRLPAKMEMWVEDEKKMTRELISVDHPEVTRNFFQIKRDELPQVHE